MAALPAVAEILAATRARGERVVAVVSALAGVTDSLVRALESATAGERWAYLAECGQLRDRHLELAQSLIHDEEILEPLLAQLNERCDAHLQICDAVHILGEATPRIRASAMSFGERLSAPLLAALLRQEGLATRALSTNGSDGQPSQQPLILTDDAYMSANPLWSPTAARLREVILPMLEAGEIPVLTGFIGATAAGHTTTLGRGGSDFSAAIVARCCESCELIIWTDVDGVMTVDPRLDDRARVLESVTYTEVGQLAYFWRAGTAPADRATGGRGGHPHSCLQYLPTSRTGNVNNSRKCSDSALEGGHPRRNEHRRCGAIDGERARDARCTGDRRARVLGDGQGRRQHSDDFTVFCGAKFLLSSAGGERRRRQTRGGSGVGGGDGAWRCGCCRAHGGSGHHHRGRRGHATHARRGGGRFSPCWARRASTSSRSARDRVNAAFPSWWKRRNWRSQYAPSMT